MGSEVGTGRRCGTAAHPGPAPRRASRLRPLPRVPKSCGCPGRRARAAWRFVQDPGAGGRARDEWCGGRPGSWGCAGARAAEGGGRCGGGAWEAWVVRAQPGRSQWRSGWARAGDLFPGCCPSKRGGGGRGTGTRGPCIWGRAREWPRPPPGSRALAPRGGRGHTDPPWHLGPCQVTKTVVTPCPSRGTSPGPRPLAAHKTPHQGQK